MGNSDGADAPPGRRRWCSRAGVVRSTGTRADRPCSAAWRGGCHLDPARRSTWMPWPRAWSTGSIRSGCRRRRSTPVRPSGWRAGCGGRPSRSGLICCPISSTSSSGSVTSTGPSPRRSRCGWWPTRSCPTWPPAAMPSCPSTSAAPTGCTSRSCVGLRPSCWPCHSSTRCGVPTCGSALSDRELPTRPYGQGPAAPRAWYQRDRRLPLGDTAPVQWARKAKHREVGERMRTDWLAGSRWSPAVSSPHGQTWELIDRTPEVVTALFQEAARAPRALGDRQGGPAVRAHATAWAVHQERAAPAHRRHRHLGAAGWASRAPGRDAARRAVVVTSPSGSGW